MVTRQDENLLAALARAAEWRLSEFNAQCVANTAWALAIVNHRDETLLVMQIKCQKVQGDTG